MWMLHGGEELATGISVHLMAQSRYCSLLYIVWLNRVCTQKFLKKKIILLTIVFMLCNSSQTCFPFIYPLTKAALIPHRIEAANRNGLII